MAASISLPTPEGLGDTLTTCRLNSSTWSLLTMRLRTIYAAVFRTTTVGADHPTASAQQESQTTTGTRSSEGTANTSCLRPAVHLSSTRIRRTALYAAWIRETASRARFDLT